MNRRADHWLPRPVFTQYLPRLAVLGAAVKGHKETHAPQQTESLFDHLVGEREQF
jgi:hypothetical protein